MDYSDVGADTCRDGSDIASDDRLVGSRGILVNLSSRFTASVMSVRAASSK